MLKDRDIRQRDIVPVGKLANQTVSVIGVGAIGRQVATQLAAIGVPKVKIYDFDIVEIVNLAAQGFLESDLGLPKVEAVAKICKAINSEIEITPINARFKRSDDTRGIIFCCVDSIKTREFIWNAIKDDTFLFIDARMSAETFRILTASKSDVDYYPTTLFQPEEAFTGSCTTKSTIFCASIAAGMMIEQLARWLRDIPTDQDLQFNLLSSEITVR